MQYSHFKWLVHTDLYRYTGQSDGARLWYHLIWTPGFRYTTLLRTYAFVRTRPWGRFGIRQLVALAIHRYSILYGISISPDCTLGPGLYIGHHGGIVVNRDAVIGANCNLSQGVTIGQINVGERTGCPTVGNNVYIGPGAKIIGRIEIGADAAIGANAVVVDDVAPGTVVGGVPARVLSQKGSHGYVNRTDYPPAPRA